MVALTFGKMNKNETHYTKHETEGGAYIFDPVKEPVVEKNTSSWKAFFKFAIGAFIFVWIWNKMNSAATVQSVAVATSISVHAAIITVLKYLSIVAITIIGFFQLIKAITEKREYWGYRRTVQALCIVRYCTEISFYLVKLFLRFVFTKMKIYKPKNTKVSDNQIIAQSLHSTEKKSDTMQEKSTIGSDAKIEDEQARRIALILQDVHTKGIDVKTNQTSEKLN